MKPDVTSSDLHERARRLIALSSPPQVFHDADRVSAREEASSTERSWLAAHLQSCPPCREFAESTGETIRALRSIPLMADASLVSTTQTRVRQRAQELLRRQERLRVIWVCSAAVTLCTAFNTALLWRGLAWLSQWLSEKWGPQWLGQRWIGQQAPLFELAFVALCFMPAVVAGIILLARGTYMADHNGSFQG